MFGNGLMAALVLVDKGEGMYVMRFSFRVELDETVGVDSDPIYSTLTFPTLIPLLLYPNPNPHPHVPQQ